MCKIKLYTQPSKRRDAGRGNKRGGIDDMNHTIGTYSNSILTTYHVKLKYIHDSILRFKVTIGVGGRVVANCEIMSFNSLA